MIGTAIKDSPILFSAPMVRATLAGRKTQTRRIVKPQPHEDCGSIVAGCFSPRRSDSRGIELPGNQVFGAYDCYGEWGVKCPYGAVGDRLWVREKFQIGGNFEVTESAVGAHPARGEIVYAADQLPPYGISGRPWKPSIFMPRRASRITLELLAVGVQRLQDISREDVRAEGIPECYGDVEGWVESRFPGTKPHEWDNLRWSEQWAKAWDATNGDGAWKRNDWVWVLSFKMVRSSDGL